MICWKCWWPLSSPCSWDKGCKDLMFQVSINPSSMLLTHKNYLMTHVLLMHFRSDKKLKFRFMIIAICLLLASCLAYNLILKMEAQCSYKTMVDFYQTTKCYNRENLILILRVLKILWRQIKVTNVTVSWTDVTAETSHYM